MVPKPPAPEGLLNQARPTVKIQIVYLDPEDDQASAREKIAWAKAPRIVMVWPARGRALTRRLDLRLLQRAAGHKGAQLALICLDPDVRAHADHLGIPVFDSLESMPEAGWRSRRVPSCNPIRPTRRALELPAPRPASKPLPPAARALLFALPWISLLLLALFWLPAARIVVHPHQRPVESTVVLALVEAETDLEVPEDTLPAERVSVTVEGQTRIPTSGRALIPHEPAQGEVVFQNLTDEAITVPGGTTVRSLTTPEIFFITGRPAYLEAREGAESRVPIVASEPGPAGNLPAGSITAIDGPLGLKIAVTNPAPTSGGNQTLGYVVSIADQARARELLESQLLQQAAQLLSAKLASGERLLPASLAIRETLQKAYDRPLGEPADTLGLRMLVRVEAWSYREMDLLSALEASLRQELKPGEEIVPGNLSVADVSEPENGTEEEVPTLTISAKAWAYSPIDRQQARHLLRASPATQAAAILERVTHAQGDPDIAIWPPWWPLMPMHAERIVILYPWEVEGA